MNAGKTPIERILRPLQAFTEREASSGILLLVCTVVAMVWANSYAAETYAATWQTPFGIRFGTFALEKPLLLWINDLLMAVFFLVIGLEIKREVLVGELSSIRRAMLPLFAAVGGMLAPAVIYAFVNRGNPGGQSGWGIPMATDIAFAMGIIALCGPRVPTAVRIFVVALAIVDDLGAVLVIAFFYSGSLNLDYLAQAAMVWLLMVGLGRMGVRALTPFMVLAVVLWFFVLKAGIHATIAGVLTALTIPVQSRIDAIGFSERAESALSRFRESGPRLRDTMLNEQQEAVLHSLERSIERVGTPLQRLMHVLHPVASWVIMPIFALANAGVAIAGGTVSDPVTLGIVLGLVVGKPLGILSLCAVAVKFNLAELPSGTTWLMLFGASVLGGVGFTMSLFIASLAFKDGQLLADAKIGVLIASVIAGGVGFAVLRSACAKSANVALKA
jgi:NhaA family Na+:H+ antiporter